MKPGSRAVIDPAGHAAHDWRHPARALLSVVLMEFGDFPMMRRMLRGIKDRAEQLDRGV